MSSTTTTTTQQRNGVLKSTLDTSNTASSINIPRGSVTSTLTFYSPPKDGSAPYNYVEPQSEGTLQRNYEEHPHTVTIDDIRGNESSFSLNQHGFAVAQNIPSQEKDFTDDDHIKSTYYPEIEELILSNVPGANRVFIFDHTIRRAGPDAKRGPVNRAHIDQTGPATQQRIRYHLPAEADTLLQSRYRIINVWRPLNGPVVASPLAFAASDTVPDDAVVPVEHRYPHRVGQTAGIRATEGQQWHYWSGMGNEERLFLQCYDSEGNRARVPHTAFKDPRTQDGWPGRESIEVRALVFG